MDFRFVPQGTESCLTPWLKRYGTYNCGAELMTSAWKRMEHVFAVRRSSVAPPRQETAATVTTNFPGLQPSFLTAHPVDLFVVECCSFKRPPKNVPHWEAAVDNTKQSSRPKVVLESWDPRCNTWIRGPTDKSCITRWSKLGYETRTKLVSCTKVGGALEQIRLIVAQVQNPTHQNGFGHPSLRLRRVV